MNYELKIVWKEVVVVCLKVIYQDLFEEMGKTMVSLRTVGIRAEI